LLKTKIEEKHSNEKKGKFLSKQIDFVFGFGQVSATSKLNIIVY
jgi:hypothetical protein